MGSSPPAGATSPPAATAKAVAATKAADRIVTEALPTWFQLDKPQANPGLSVERTADSKTVTRARPLDPVRALGRREQMQGRPRCC
jgi:hypothetical protein